MEHYEHQIAAPFRSRPDLSRDVLHLTRGETRSVAFATLKAIVRERELRGGTGMIRGAFRCVCFTEAPIRQLSDVFRRSAAKPLRFQPYGVLLGKDYLFARGGRPVIYQPDADFDLLPDQLKYRHVRYDPVSDPQIDFTWEREWRVRADAFSLDSERCTLVVANADDRNALVAEHAAAEQVRIEELVQAVGRSTAMQYEEVFPWTVLELNV